MSKPVHPIRQMRQEFHEHLAGAYFVDDKPGERILARHVEPLLDALARRIPAQEAESWCECPDCRLLAAWKAKL
jgi:hypothetical protein